MSEFSQLIPSVTKMQNSSQPIHQENASSKKFNQANSQREWLWLIPFAAALYYPWALQWANTTIASIGQITPYAFIQILTAYTVPIIGFAVLHHLGKQETLTDRLVLARRLSYLVVAAPPAFTLVGVLLFLMKINGHDNAVWTGIWLVLTILSTMMIHTMPRRPVVLNDPAMYRRLRVLHGVFSVFILLVFLAPHLFNHSLGLFGNNVHLAIMDVLRKVYRHPAVEPILIAAFFIQILSGIVLVKPKSERSGDILDSLQAASGVYLAFFIASHINSVFILARYFGTETDYAWATGEPVGLLMDPWNIRLLPHYSLAVFLLLAHLACGLRIVLRNHNMTYARSNAITWSIITIGFVVTLIITAGMLGFRLI